MIRWCSTTRICGLVEPEKVPPVDRKNPCLQDLQDPAPSQLTLAPCVASDIPFTVLALSPETPGAPNTGLPLGDWVLRAQNPEAHLETCYIPLKKPRGSPRARSGFLEDQSRPASTL